MDDTRSSNESRGAIDAATFEVLRHRLWAINDEAAVTIGRVSGSPIATEGNDFNSGLMTASGETVVAGIYVLVHAAALGRIVRDVIDNYTVNPGINPGDMFLTNDTYVGAPHQADVIVVAPIFNGDRLVAWTGSCVHQADVGGPVPGSITVGARNIYEEALPISPVKIVERGVMRADIEREYLHRSRTPELNRLDLLGQIAANRVQTERIIEMCAKYGTDTVVATLDRMIDSTEQRLRQRLRSLPDGTWRHVGFCEHDGVADKVYAVRLTFTKRGDRLTLDFTESSDQAPALINTAEPTTSGYAMAAVMTVLGYGLPWTPAAFWRVMDVRTRPGSVVHAVMPAGMSMGVTSAGQEVRTSVNMCIDRMLDASDEPEHHAQIFASCSSSSATSTISGTFADGRTFATMLLDGVTAGMGGRALADGLDTGGMLTAPAGLCANVEVSELNYPMRYLWRRERADSGGPGVHRGGVGADNAYTPHRAGDAFGATMFAHGTEPPTAAGVLGGEPGMQNAFGIERDGVVVKRKAKEVAVLEPGDVFHNWCAGGGGVGDPLDRPVAEVERDIEDGLVSVEGALRDYGVVAGGDSAAERAHRRRARLGGRTPLPRLDAPLAGRRLSSNLVVREGSVVCRWCATVLCPVSGGTTDVKGALTVQELRVGYRWPLVDTAPGAARFVFRRFHCPGCATQVDAEVNLIGEPFVRSLEVEP